LCLLLGVGVPRDVARATTLLRAAAALPYADAQCNLGVALLAGLSGGGDAVKAAAAEQEGLALLRAAAESGLADAQYNLALCQAAGRGCVGGVPDLQTARTLMQAAAAANHGEAICALGRYCTLLSGGGLQTFLTHRHPLTGKWTLQVF
jgi:TPR repeat protein